MNQMGSQSLSWLQLNENWPEDFKQVSNLPDISFDKLVQLANYSQDFLQTIKLDRILRKKFERPPSDIGTQPIRLAVLASSTVEQLAAGIRVAGLRRNLWVDLYVGSYGQYRQELFDSASPLHQFCPNSILFSLDPESILGKGNPEFSLAEAEQHIDHALDQLRTLWGQAAQLCKGLVIQQAFIPVGLPLVGGNEHRLPGSLYSMIIGLNFRLRNEAAKQGVAIVALDDRVKEDGLLAWYDPGLWYRSKQQITPAMGPLYGDLVGRLLMAAQGRSSKCLVLDLDHTLWGGVIGDDGLAGIQLGQGSGVGEAFVAFQHYVKQLSQRGVILAVCSKNDEANALSPFEKHPEMVLKRSDIACFVANWEDKASNIRHIAASLNIGLDSLVFVDDNPFERNVVRRELPMVAVPEMPDDPSYYARCLAEAGYFEALTITDGDLQRTQQYQSNAKRESLRSSSTDMDGYLRSLEMQLSWSVFDDVSVQRVTQLINKTNQFNLTTRRYSESEVIDVMQNTSILKFQLRLVDQLGDNGIISILIARPDGQTESAMRIDTWLMSCRVLGRQVERAVLNLLVFKSKEMGVESLVGEYRPTEKNGMVRDHYNKLGFKKLNEGADGVTLWKLDLNHFSPLETFIDTKEVKQ